MFSNDKARLESAVDMAKAIVPDNAGNSDNGGEVRTLNRRAPAFSSNSSDDIQTSSCNESSFYLCFRTSKFLKNRMSKTFFIFQMCYINYVQF